MNSDQKMRVLMYVGNKVDGEGAMIISNKLETANEKVTSALMFSKLYDKVIIIVLSIFLGDLAVDRFYLKDYGIAIAKLGLFLTSWTMCIIGLFVPVVGVLGFMGISVAGIWKIVDIFLCYKRSQKKNLNTILEVIAAHPQSGNSNTSSEVFGDIF